MEHAVNCLSSTKDAREKIQKNEKTFHEDFAVRLDQGLKMLNLIIKGLRK